jgi:hypothetical protein
MDAIERAESNVRHEHVGLVVGEKRSGILETRERHDGMTGMRERAIEHLEEHRIVIDYEDAF